MPVSRPRFTPLAFTFALTVAACGSDADRLPAKPDRERQEPLPQSSGEDPAAKRVAELEREVAQLRPRASAYRHLEFLGDAPPLDGARSTFEVLATSAAPEAATSDYPDCLAVSRCAVAAAGAHTAADEILVVTVAFHDRKPTPAFALPIGSRHSAQLVPWAEMPESVRSIQRVDETDRFDLPMFAAIDQQPANEREVVHPPLGDDPPISQQQAIAASIARIEALERQHGSFAAWQQQLEPQRVDLSRRLTEAGGPIYDGTRIAIRNLHYIKHEPGEQWPGPQVAFFVELRDQLAARGIDLIVVPFPEQEQLATLALAKDPPADGIMHPYRLFWHLSLLRAGVEVVDLLPALIAASDRYPNVFYDAIDGHPADGGIVTAATEIAKRLRRYTDLPRAYQELVVEQRRYGIPDRYPKFLPRARAADCYSASSVLLPDGKPLPNQFPQGPVLLLGDSFVGVPNGFGVPSADIPSHLVKETGLAIRRRSIGGSAAQLMVHLAQEASELLDGVRVLIYLFREDYMFQDRADEPKYHWQMVKLPTAPR